MKTTRANELVGEVCLYGAPHCGYGYIAQARDGKMFGDGEPVKGCGATDALWFGLGWFRGPETAEGIIRVFDSGGERMAEISIAEVNRRGYFPYYGDLKWAVAPVLTISAEAIIAAGEEPR
jgi:hypothetical protein